jgi:hypothetical protein
MRAGLLSLFRRQSDLGHHRRLERVRCREDCVAKVSNAVTWSPTSLFGRHTWSPKKICVHAAKRAFPHNRTDSRRWCQSNAGRQVRHATASLPIVFVNVTHTIAGAKARAAYSTETRTTPASIMPRARAAFTDRSMMRPRMNGPLSAIRHWIDRPE